jgi:DNA-binding LacI/PurR family transcriptional regulator
VSDPFLAQLVRGIEDIALEHGYTVILSSFYGEPDREKEVLSTFRERRVDGIIAESSCFDAYPCSLLPRFDLPIVLINRPEYIYSVSTNNLHGGRLATVSA